MSIYRKRQKFFFICTLSVLLFVCFGCGSNDISSEVQADQSNLSDINISPEPSIEVEDQIENTEAPFIIIDKFIDLYNSFETVQITDISEMDMHGVDYRTEYRLNAFKNSVGKKCSVGSSFIEIVNYGTWSNDSIRFYVYSDSIDSITELFTSIIHILDNAISDDEINEICDSLNDNDQNFLLGKGNYIKGYIISNYKDGVIGGYDMMIDCSKINYLE